MNPSKIQIARPELAAALRALGVRRGGVLLVHSSLSRIGHVEGGAGTVVDALLEAIGPAGTLVAPTIIHTSGLPRPPFDSRCSPSEVGAITECLRLREGAIRSEHPTHSVAAIGPRAAELTRGHATATGPWTPWGRAAFGRGSPWDLLYHCNAQCLLLGVSFQVCTLFHYAQTEYLRRHQPPRAEPIPFPYFSHQAMGGRLAAGKVVCAGRVGLAECQLTDARAVVDATLETLENPPDGFFSNSRDGGFSSWLARRPKTPVTLSAGLASVPMTPDGETRSMDGTCLNLRLLVIRDAQRMAAVASLPLPFLTTEQAAYLRERMSKAVEIPPDAIMLACTHVHSGPRPEETEALMQPIASSLARAASEACSRLAPIRIGAHKRRLTGVSRVRRILMTDGRVHTIRRAVPSTWRTEDKDGFVGPESPLDDELVVVRLEDAQRRAIGCLFHFTTHPIPDLHGFAADQIECNAGRGFVCLPLNGALGDVDTPFDRPVAGRFEADQLPVLGGALAGAVAESLARSQVRDGGAVRIVRSRVELPAHPAEGANHRHEPADRVARTASRGIFEINMPALRMGPVSLLGIPGELACKLGAQIKRGGADDEVCLPVGLVDGYVGYLIPRKAMLLGGYEADPGHWCLAAPGSAETVVETAKALQARWG